MADVQTGTIETDIPARLDRLPWARFHWMVVIGLGTVWILDGLEVTIVGAIASRLTEKGSGIELSAGQIGTAAAIYVAGACLGALFFGQLTDRFGRKKLFIITLGVYILATVATAFAFNAWYFYAARFVTGAGIGGEYAAINSAIDELIPARVRGRVDLIINGSYWVGSAIGSAFAILLLDPSFLAKDIGWRVAFAIGAVLGLTIMLVRRHVPESPRWLFIHGREEEAEAIVNDIESAIEEESSEQLQEPDDSIKVRQREVFSFREIGRTAFKLYPKRAVLGLALFVGQAFLYNGVTFNLGTLFSTFYGVSSSFVPVFLIVFAIGNFLGPLVLGRLFDTVGRKPMIAGTYIGSAVVAAIMAALFTGHILANEWYFEGFIFLTFFLASAGASAAYLTVSEIFPMETRALAIAFFYAIGTAVGGISGPLLFGRLIESADRGNVAIAFYIGAVVMAIGGIVELFYGVKAEQQTLEDIAKPLTVEEAEEGGAEGEEAAGEDAHPERREALACRAQAEEERAHAAEHRACMHELRARASAGDARAEERLEAENVLAEIADHRARGFDEQAAAHEERRNADEAEDDADREAALERSRAADERARVHEERAEAIAAEHAGEEERHAELAEAAAERSRAREQRAAAAEARGEADGAEGGAEVAAARAEMHGHWADMHEARARIHELRGEGAEDAELAEHERRAAGAEELALAAEQRVGAAEHRQAADEVRGEREQVEQTAEQRRRAEERARRRRDAEARIRERVARRRQRDRAGLRRYRPGPGQSYGSPAMLGTALRSRPTAAEEALDREIDVIGAALDEHGETDRRELARLVGARYWGPGRFREALREAAADGRIRRLSRTTYAPPEGNGDDDG